MVDVKCDRVAYLFCPQYKGLALKHILARLEHHPEVEQYLPDDQIVTSYHGSGRSTSSKVK